MRKFVAISAMRILSRIYQNLEEKFTWSKRTACYTTFTAIVALPEYKVVLINIRGTRNARDWRFATRGFSTIPVSFSMLN